MFKLYYIYKNKNKNEKQLGEISTYDDHDF